MRRAWARLLEAVERGAAQLRERAASASTPPAEKPGERRSLEQVRADERQEAELTSRRLAARREPGGGVSLDQVRAAERGEAEQAARLRAERSRARGGGGLTLEQVRAVDRADAEETARLQAEHSPPLPGFPDRPRPPADASPALLTGLDPAGAFLPSERKAPRKPPPLPSAAAPPAATPGNGEPAPPVGDESLSAAVQHALDGIPARATRPVEPFQLPLSLTFGMVAAPEFGGALVEPVHAELLARASGRWDGRRSPESMLWSHMHYERLRRPRARIPARWRRRCIAKLTGWSYDAVTAEAWRIARICPPRVTAAGKRERSARRGRQSGVFRRAAVFERDRIVTILLDEGMSQAGAAAVVGVHASTVSRTAARMERTLSDGDHACREARNVKLRRRRGFVIAHAKTCPGCFGCMDNLPRARLQRQKGRPRTGDVAETAVLQPAHVDPAAVPAPSAARSDQPGQGFSADRARANTKTPDPESMRLAPRAPRSLAGVRRRERERQRGDPATQAARTRFLETLKAGADAPRSSAGNSRRESTPSPLDRVREQLQKDSATAAAHQRFLDALRRPGG